MSIATERNNLGGAHRNEAPSFDQHNMACDESPEKSDADRRLGEAETDPSSSISASSTSSIGKNSDEASGGGSCSDAEEVQSGYKGGPLDSLESLEEVLPVKKSISKFYNGKSKSYTSLYNAASGSIEEIIKPENAYTKKRKNLLAFNNLWDNNRNSTLRSHNSTMSKRSTNSRSMLVLAANINCYESNSGETPTSMSSSPGFCLPPLPPHARRAINIELSSSPPADKFGSRSFSLYDLRVAAAAEAAIPSITGLRNMNSDKSSNSRALSSLTSAYIVMDGTQYSVSLSDFKLFHGIDRALYRIIVWDLLRNPVESLYILGLWLWLERQGFYSLIRNILSLPHFLINELTDEAMTCIKCVHPQFPYPSEFTEIPLTQSLVKKDISLQFFYDRHLTAFSEVQDLVRSVCIPSMSELMKRGSHGLGESSTQNYSVSSLRIMNGDVGLYPPGGAPVNESLRIERTLFVTFSKGYPVSEAEVRQFFVSLFGNCIESFHMQEVGPMEQALYAKIMFLSPAFIQNILNGVRKARFTINGKHVWMRRFIPREA